MWDSDVIILNISMAHRVPVGTVYVVGWCISRKQIGYAGKRKRCHFGDF